MEIQEKNVDMVMIFNYKEIIETLEEKLNENSYIRKSNWRLCIVLALLGCTFFSMNALINLPKFLQLSCLFTGLTFFLGFSFFFTKIFIENKMHNEIIKLMNEFLNLKNIDINIKTTDIFIKKISQGIYGSYLIDETNKKYNILCPFVPDYIVNQKINVLIYEDKILDFFYF